MFLFLILNEGFFKLLLLTMFTNWGLSTKGAVEGRP